jgi:predicted nucleotidyltransferase
MKLTKQELETIRDYFKNQPVLRAYLFGSYARGEADTESDIDLLVDLEELLNRKVDVVPSDGVRSYVKPQVEKEKQLIYAR